MTEIKGTAKIKPWDSPGFFSVTIDWDANVVRKNTGGWVVPAKYANRLAAAINAQKAFKNVRILTDDNGNTYVGWESLVWGKRLNKDLTNLGF